MPRKSCPFPLLGSRSLEGEKKRGREGGRVEDNDYITVLSRVNPRGHFESMSKTSGVGTYMDK